MLESILQGRNLQMCTTRPQGNEMKHQQRHTYSNLSGASGGVFLAQGTKHQGVCCALGVPGRMLKGGHQAWLPQKSLEARAANWDLLALDVSMVAMKLCCQSPEQPGTTGVAGYR